MIRNRKTKIFLSTLTICTLSFNLASTITYAQEESASHIELKNYVLENTQQSLEANRPTASYWYPQDLLNWSEETDSNSKFNKSTIPLAKRVEKEKLETSNENQSKDSKVMAIVGMNSSTSGNPSQGSNEFTSNTFSYWQYVDKLVYWGGSAGEGIIVPPSADATDSAHKNGVPILGTVFFPQNEHGGKLQWLNEFLEKDSNGNFKMVDKLIEVCNIYGFDGWFINQETQGTTKEHADLMQEFIKSFKEKAPDLELTWYDSMTNDGAMDWQNALTDKNKMFLIDENGAPVADDMFLNFWWTYNSLAPQKLLEKSKNKAEELGLDTFDLYAGIDVEANGFNTNIKWDLFAENGKNPFTSLGLYSPSWTYKSSKTVEEFQEKENRFWVNEKGNPSDLSDLEGNGWRGISNYIVEKTAVTSLPFITNFSMGNGKEFYVDGEKVSDNNWNNRSLQDVMPTYRWAINNEGENNLDADMDYETAYYGGNSVKLSGNLVADNSSTIKLYSADLQLNNDVEFSTVAKSNAENISMDLVLEFHDETSATIEGNTLVGSEWTKINYDITPFAEKSIKNISYKISSSTNIEDLIFNIGNISVETTNSHEVVNINDVKIEDAKFGNDIYAGVKLNWTSTDNNNTNVNHYEVYKVNENGSKEYLGATPNTNYYINDLKRIGKEDSTTFEIVAINKNYERGLTSTTTMEWPSYPVPESSFSVSKTLVAPGEEVTFENTSSEVTEEIEWIFAGANIENSTEQNPTVTYAEEGIYPVTLRAKNTSGEDVEIKKGLVTVTNAVNEGKVNLSVGKTATATSFVNPAEGPAFAIDGKYETKWCATADGLHALTIDLGNINTISDISIKHAEAGGESSSMNTSAYTVEISNDGENFTELIKVVGNKDGVTNDPVEVSKARYVRLSINKPTQGGDKATRIYEVEVIGLEGDVELPPIYEVPEIPEEIIVSKPSNLKAGEVTSNTVALNWNKPEHTVGLVGYEIYKDGKLLIEIDSTNTNYVVEGLRANTNYGFKVITKYSNDKKSKPVSINIRTKKK